MSKEWIAFILLVFLMNVTVSDSILEMIIIHIFSTGIFFGGMAIGAQLHKEGKIR